MTTYRRICCNDLLRLGSINLNFYAPTQSMRIYMKHLAVSPGNFIVAHVPGGRIAGYVYAQIAGEDHYCIGMFSALSVAYNDMPDLAKTLSKLLEDSCEKIYNACAMQRFIPGNDSRSINTLSELGYQMYKQDQEKSEMRKPLPRLAAMFPGLIIS